MDRSITRADLLRTLAGAGVAFCLGGIAALASKPLVETLHDARTGKDLIVVHDRGVHTYVKTPSHAECPVTIYRPATGEMICARHGGNACCRVAQVRYQEMQYVR